MWLPLFILAQYFLPLSFPRVDNQSCPWDWKPREAKHTCHQGLPFPTPFTFKKGHEERKGAHVVFQSLKPDKLKVGILRRKNTTAQRNYSILAHIFVCVFVSVWSLGLLFPPGAVLLICICKKKPISSSCSVCKKSFPLGRQFSDALTRRFLRAGETSNPCL